MKVYEATVEMEPPDGYDTPVEMQVTFFAEDMEDAGTLALDLILDCAEAPVSDLELAQVAVDADEFFDGEGGSSPDEPSGSRPATTPSPPSPTIDGDDEP